MYRTVLSVVLAASVGCTAAQAQTMKPGLWEMTQKMQSASGEMEKGMADMQKQLAALPPEQRKMMQDMMARQGVNMAAGPGGAMLSKMCLTKEMVERNQLPVHEKGNCTNTVSNQSAAGMNLKFVCTDPAATGEGRVNFKGDSAYDMKMTMNSNHQGKPMTTTLDASGKWLGADCGAIKPLALPAPPKK